MFPSYVTYVLLKLNINGKQIEKFEKKKLAVTFLCHYFSNLLWFQNTVLHISSCGKQFARRDCLQKLKEVLSEKKNEIHKELQN